MDADSLRMKLAQICETFVFKESLCDLERESRKLRFRRLAYLDSLNEFAGDFARTVVSAINVEGLTSEDVDQLRNAIIVELVRQTRDTF